MFTVQGFGNKKWSAIWAIRQHPKNRSKKTGPAQSNHTLYRISIYLSIYIWDIHTYMGYLYGIYAETNGIWVLWDVCIYIWDLDGFIWENTKHHSDGLYGQNKT